MLPFACFGFTRSSLASRKKVKERIMVYCIRHKRYIMVTVQQTHLLLVCQSYRIGLQINTRLYFKHISQGYIHIIMNVPKIYYDILWMSKDAYRIYYEYPKDIGTMTY
uniref:Uncharacterized protein n=1 Tax=Cacopsylla melanoneura TaxID=428564 RepID=A0A8D9FFH1_9HEMI